MRQPQRRNRQHAESVFIDQKRILIRPVRRTAGISPPATAASIPGRSPGDPGTITQSGHVFLQPVARQRAGALLSRDHRRRHALFLQPIKSCRSSVGCQKNRSIRQPDKQALNRVQHHSFGHFTNLNRIIQPDKNPFQNALARFLEFRLRSIKMKSTKSFFFATSSSMSESQRARVFNYILSASLQMSSARPAH